MKKYFVYVIYKYFNEYKCLSIIYLYPYSDVGYNVILPTSRIKINVNKY